MSASLLDDSVIFANDFVPLPWLDPSRIRKAGCVNCIVPLKNPTSPDNIRRVFSTRVLLVYFALKNVAVTFGLRLPSVMTRYSRFGCRFVHRSSALEITSTKVMCSPSSGGSASSPRTDTPALYLRG